MLSSEMTLQNRYRVIRPLGRGGMGAVYEAFDERLSRTVALKETLVETDELRRAFGREARLLANLRHPALPKVLDHFDEAGGLFLVMEFIPGEDLGRQLETGRAFAPAEVSGWAEQLLDALEYLHGLSPPVLHRDIKPSNLKVVSPGHVVLLDFGLAKGNAGQMTATGGASLLGYSPAYSPLEQMQGTGTDERSDLYSLAATLYHLLAGVSPPDALSRATAVVNGRPDPLRPPHQLNQGVSVPVSAALMRAMALDIESRPRSASEMREQMRGTAPRAAHTVPMVDDEVTKVGVAPPTDGRERRGFRIATQARTSRRRARARRDLGRQTSSGPLEAVGPGGRAARGAGLALGPALRLFFRGPDGCRDADESARARRQPPRPRVPRRPRTSTFSPKSASLPSSAPRNSPPARGWRERTSLSTRRHSRGPWTGATPKPLTSSWRRG